MTYDFGLPRSVLSVPANREKMINKALDLPADMIMLDLEDSVPVSEKTEARKFIISALQHLDFGNKIRAVRINDMNTPFAYRDLIDIMEFSGKFVDVLIIPKVESTIHVTTVDCLLNQIEINQGFEKKVSLQASIESASGMMRVDQIAFCTKRLGALVFGIADYTTSLGMLSKGISGHGEAEGFYPGHRWHYPLSRMSMAAKAAGLQAIDAPYGDYRNPVGLRESCLMSLSLGYDGKWAIHPDQLEIINEVYTPTEEDIKRSEKIVAAYQEQQESGSGTLSIEGKMIDAATLRQAQRILQKGKTRKKDG